MTARGELEPALQETPDGVRLRLKVAAGSSRSALVGLWQDRLKIAVAAPAEAGKANQAVCQLLAKVIGVPNRQVVIVEGERSTMKTIAIRGARLATVAAKLSATLKAVRHRGRR